jgi:serine/threonine-protein kinase PknG
MTTSGTTGPVTACQQPGCTGTIEADGYCGRCGLQAGAAAAAGTTVAGPAPPPAARVSVPVPSSRGTTGSRPSANGRRRLGAGLIELPPVPVRDPATAVLENPQVEESKRFCSSSRHPVGRGRDGQPGRTEGFCPVDGAQYSFTPKLERGEMVSGQYEVVGCLAYGGQGWIYLARDHHLDKEWVVLKGLLDTGDAAAQAAAIAERRFLVEAKHPGIVSVYNFVQHADRRTQTTAGYIVLEYVGGQSLKQMAAGLLPLEHALTYATEALTALGYLHSKGLVYCDFKPDNTMLAEDHLKLIDMGAVRRIDDVISDIYGTPGYQAPEIARDGALPSPSSDLYTVGRTLAVTTFNFAGFTREHLYSLPAQETVPLLAEQDSYYRLLRRATDPDPLRRFTTAAEMAEQLTGVLREVLSTSDHKQRPSLSTLFSPELQAIGAATAAGGAGPPRATAAAEPVTPADILAGMPAPLADSDDPAAGYLATLSALDARGQAAELAAVVAAGPKAPPGVADSVEVRLALARARIMTGDLVGAAADLVGLVDAGRGDWRVTWYQGLIELAGGHPDHARAEFEGVYDTLPGELAPRLAVALAAEAAGHHAAAARHFQVVWTIDHSYVSAAFGLARVRLAGGDTAGAIEVLDTVPETSSHHVAAQVGALRARISGPPPAGLSLASLTEAGQQLQQLRLDAASQESLTAELLRAALGWVATGQAPASQRLLGWELTERSLRFGLEQAYRSLARLVSAEDRRIQLVDLANDVRPWTRS